VVRLTFAAAFFLLSPFFARSNGRERKRERERVNAPSPSSDLLSPLPSAVVMGKPVRLVDTMPWGRSTADRPYLDSLVAGGVLPPKH